MELKSLFSTSCLTTCFFVVYLLMAFTNLYKLMYPLSFLDTSSTPNVRSYWEEASEMNMKVYLSSIPKFQLDFLRVEYSEQEGAKQARENTVLLWQEELTQASLTKSFLLTNEHSPARDASYEYACSWLDQAEHHSFAEQEGILSALSASAGEGIESTSVLLTIYNAVSKQIVSLLSILGLTDTHAEAQPEPKATPERASLSLPTAMWNTLQSNSTLYIHVVVEKITENTVRNVSSPTDAQKALRNAAYSYAALFGFVNLVKVRCSTPCRTAQTSFIHGHFVSFSTTCCSQRG